MFGALGSAKSGAAVNVNEVDSLYKETVGYVYVTKCRCRGASMSRPISLNKNYAGRLHRDAGNIRPSIDLSIGPCTGGNLRYWASQKGARSSRVEVRGEPSLALNIMRGTVFDGNSDNEVEPFKGERYSLIFGDEAGCAAIFEVRTVRHHLVARRHVRNGESADLPRASSV